MSNIRNNYNEGDLFGVPIGVSEFIIGLVAKINHNKMLCYFFSRKVTSLSDIHIAQSDILLVTMCSTLGLDYNTPQIRYQSIRMLS